MENNSHFLGDNAINNPGEDLFNFKTYAEKVQKLIQLYSDNPEAITIGVYGKWGEGKTSFLNLLENKIDEFEKPENGKEFLKYHFNPWRYSNEDEMMFDFFDGLAKRFYIEKNTTIQNVGKQINKYSKYLKAIKISATVGMPKRFSGKVSFDVSEVLKALGEDLSGEEVTLDKLKDKVNDAIKKSNFKIIVFIDDLDRLDKDEIYTILKLVKLNANFKNFVFIISLDSEHVSKAISIRYGSKKSDGKNFLEKIINIPIHLPKIEEADLKNFFRVKLATIQNALSFHQAEKKSEEFKDIDREFSGIYFSSPREIIKVLNGFFVGAFAIADDVNLRDLFWIEYIKIKNEACYNYIKKYQGDPYFPEFARIIDFSNSQSEESKNEIRYYIKNEYKGVFDIVNMLFPENIKNGSVFANELDANVLESDLRINSKEHFDKYFSYHTVGKISAIKINSIEKLIEEWAPEKLKILLTDLFSNPAQQYKILYKLEGIIKTLPFNENRNKFFKFLFESPDLIPETQQDMFGLDYKLRIIELVASILDTQDEVKEDYLISLAEDLDVFQLCHFTRKFKNSTHKVKLEDLIARKAKDAFSVDRPFYRIQSNANKMIMHHWQQANPAEFNDYIKATLKSEEDIKSLIRNFPSFWNNSTYGFLEKQSYDYLKSLIDVDFVYTQEEKFNPTLVESIDTKEYRINDSYEASIDENLEQFIYWYKKENNL